ncbi:MAG TPA: LuxR C-terminal-related transcriptional regulator, partial [Capillimicrobium sp.]|nr:LuxR C-terminal-related transcriptional regulator [Capillimicrobium sp.]
SAVPAGEAPALVVLDRGDRVVEATPGAAIWLRRVRDAELPTQPVPEVLLTLAAFAREQPGVTGRARMAGADGSWVSVHASATAGAGDGRVALILQAAAPPELAPMLLRALGLTKGEQEVCELVLDGRSTKEIAAELFISPWTVQDRLKAVFAKTGVRSRRELVAKLR